jgi:hypothetical protein
MRRFIVSSTYHGNGWYDPKSGINFFKQGPAGGVISVPDGVDTTNIDRYVNLNYLIELKEEVPTEDKPVIAQKTPNQILEEAAPEVAEEAPVEVAEPVVEVKAEVEEPEKVTCKFCHKEYSAKSIAKHEKTCKKNPDNQ